MLIGIAGPLPAQQELRQLRSFKKTGIECRLMSIKPSLRATIRWHDLLYVVPKLFTVGTMS